MLEVTDQGESGNMANLALEDLLENSGRIPEVTRELLQLSGTAMSNIPIREAILLDDYAQFPDITVFEGGPRPKSREMGVVTTVAGVANKLEEEILENGMENETLSDSGPELGLANGVGLATVTSAVIRMHQETEATPETLATVTSRTGTVVRPQAVGELELVPEFPIDTDGTARKIVDSAMLRKIGERTVGGEVVTVIPEKLDTVATVNSDVNWKETEQNSEVTLIPEKLDTVTGRRHGAENPEATVPPNTKFHDAPKPENRFINRILIQNFTKTQKNQFAGYYGSEQQLKTTNVEPWMYFEGANRKSENAKIFIDTKNSKKFGDKSIKAIPNFSGTSTFSIGQDLGIIPPENEEKANLNQEKFKLNTEKLDFTPEKSNLNPERILPIEFPEIRINSRPLPATPNDGREEDQNSEGLRSAPNDGALQVTPDDGPLQVTPNSERLQPTPDDSSLRATPNDGPLQVTPNSERLQPTPIDTRLHATANSERLQATPNSERLHATPDDAKEYGGDLGYKPTIFPDLAPKNNELLMSFGTTKPTVTRPWWDPTIATVSQPEWLKKALRDVEGPNWRWGSGNTVPREEGLRYYSNPPWGTVEKGDRLGVEDHEAGIPQRYPGSLTWATEATVPQRGFLGTVEKGKKVDFGEHEAGIPERYAWGSVEKGKKADFEDNEAGIPERYSRITGLGMLGDSAGDDGLRPAASTLPTPTVTPDLELSEPMQQFLAGPSTSGNFVFQPADDAGSDATVATITEEELRAERIIPENIARMLRIGPIGEGPGCPATVRVQILRCSETILDDTMKHMMPMDMSSMFGGRQPGQHDQFCANAQRYLQCAEEHATTNPDCLREFHATLDRAYLDYLPSCRPDGAYRATQCSQKGSCWCVDDFGLPMVDTFTGPNEAIADCGGGPTYSCQRLPDAQFCEVTQEEPEQAIRWALEEGVCRPYTIRECRENKFLPPYTLTYDECQLFCLYRKS
ncbi:unnamed protein product, partial [Mesorhabditis spiculigera]